MLLFCSKMCKGLFIFLLTSRRVGFLNLGAMAECWGQAGGFLNRQQTKSWRKYVQKSTTTTPNPQPLQAFSAVVLFYYHR